MSAPDVNSLQKRLIDAYQRGMPVSPTPYADMAVCLGVGENEILSALKLLTDSGVASRIGPVFRSGSVGVSTLAAMQVPQARLEDVAALVNSYREVNHNYEREHRLNLWFVITADTEKRLQEILNGIEDSTALPVISLPMQASYHIDLGFDLQWD